jgi:hypothetical protein
MKDLEKSRDPMKVIVENTMDKRDVSLRFRESNGSLVTVEGHPGLYTTVPVSLNHQSNSALGVRCKLAFMDINNITKNGISYISDRVGRGDYNKIVENSATIPGHTVEVSGKDAWRKIRPIACQPFCKGEYLFIPANRVSNITRYHEFSPISMITYKIPRDKADTSVKTRAQGFVRIRSRVSGHMNVIEGMLNDETIRVRGHSYELVCAVRRILGQRMGEMPDEQGLDFIFLGDSGMHIGITRITNGSTNKFSARIIVPMESGLLILPISFSKLKSKGCLQAMNSSHYEVVSRISKSI